LIDDGLRPVVVTAHERRQRVLLSFELSTGAVAIKELSADDAGRVARALNEAAALVLSQGSGSPVA
jgi:hypothetical protein